MKRRTADPYRDLAVIDARAPRFNQAVVGTLSLVAFLVDWWPLYAILAGQFALGLAFGRRWCLPCLLYFEVLQPRLGEGPIEDARPPRFANQVGLVVLAAASIAHAAGAEVLGWALGLMVAALALLSAATGFCAGCELYKLGARLRGIRRHALDRIDVADLGPTRRTVSSSSSRIRSAPTAARSRNGCGARAGASSPSTSRDGPSWRASTASPSSPRRSTSRRTAPCACDWLLRRGMALAFKILGGLHSKVYGLTGGAVGGRMGKAPVLFLTTTGRKSGKSRRTLCCTWKTATISSSSRRRAARPSIRPGSSTSRRSRMSRCR